MLTDEGEPECFQEAYKVETRKHKKREMEEKMDSLLKHKTWELVKPPKGRNILQNKWVYKIKHEGEKKVQGKVGGKRVCTKRRY